MSEILIAFLAFLLGCCVGGIFAVITLHDKYDLYKKEETKNE